MEQVSQEKKSNSTSLSIHSEISQANVHKEANVLYKRIFNLYELRKVKTIEQAMSMPHMRSIIYMRKKHGEVAVKVIEFTVAQFARKFNIGKNIEPAQIQDFAADLFDEYYYLKFSEVYFVLKQILTGSLAMGDRKAKVYDRIDEAVLHEFFSAYIELRFDTAEQNTIRTHHEAVHYSISDRRYDTYINELAVEKSKDGQKKKQEVLKYAKRMSDSYIRKWKSDREIIRGSIPIG